ncbi:MAG: response regulator [Anaerolineales bacterium]|nr:response regulator [Anaerolineales bacterium]
MHRTIQELLQQMGLSPSQPPNPTEWRAFLTALTERERERTSLAPSASLRALFSEPQVRQWLDGLPWGVGMVSKQGEVIWWNQTGRAWLSKQTGDVSYIVSLPTRPLFQTLRLQSNTLSQLTPPAIWQQLSAGRPFDVLDGELVCTNGDLLPATYTIMPLGKGDDFAGCLLLFRETTAQKVTAQKLREAKEDAEAASHAKSTFLANMSHELRTPLAAIIGYSELLHEQASLLGYDRFVDRLKKIHISADHLLSLINDILDLSKVEAGRMTLDNDLFTVQTLLEDVLVTTQPLTEKNQNQLVVNIGQGLGHFYGDQVKLRQILLNLLSNAAKFTRQGVVTFTAVREPIGMQTIHSIHQLPREQLRFVIADDGIGMTAQQMKHLFEPFTQADASTAREFGGTGLGLAISRRFCEMMNGRIEVVSEVGHGATFTLTLPVPHMEEVDWPERLPRLPTAEPNAIRQRILVVDDDRIIRELLGRYLVRQGFEVWLAENGYEALDIVRQVRPDAIILDIFMPGMDGWEVLARLKQDPHTADVPVILASVDDDQKHGFALGAADYLLKPFDYNLLEQTLWRHMAVPERGHILLLDDNRQIREIFREQLEVHGYRVTEAGNGQEGLAAVREDAPDLILLDLMMPEMDGFEFLLTLRDNPAWQKIPVIVISVMDLSHRERQRLNGSVERVMEKGTFGRDELVGQIHQLVHARLNPL